MINNIKLKNFKSLNFERTLELNSFNLLCGANSSGKSSLIQTILMLSQTLEARFAHNSVALNGHLVKLGGFDDVKSTHSEDNNVTVSFSISSISSDVIRQVDVEFEFGFHNAETDCLKEQLNPDLISSEIRVHHNFNDSRQGISEIVVKKKSKENINSVPDVSDYYVYSYNGEYFEDILSSYPNHKVRGCHLKGFIPKSLSVSYDNRRLSAEHLFESLTVISRVRLRGTEWQRNVNETAIPRYIFKIIFERLDQENKRKKKELATKFEQNDLFNEISVDLISSLINSDNDMPNPDDIFEIFVKKHEVSFELWLNYCRQMNRHKRQVFFTFIHSLKEEIIKEFIRNSEPDIKIRSVPLDLFFQVNDFLFSQLCNGVKYLGPLRFDPKAIYPITNLIDPIDVGIKGENAAAVFHINKNRPIIYLSPSVFSSTVDGYDFSKTTISKFKNAAIEWLVYMGVVEGISTEDKGKFGYELKVKTSNANGNSLQDLTHVGVGVSQVIPIVMQCLLSKPGDILIFEQPELHLHPKVQARLTDFFVAISALNRQVIVETHSEYMINRLRYRIASTMSDDINDFSNVMFVNKISGNSIFENVEISKFGAIKEWPNEFFDQTQNEVERILLAATNKKKKVRRDLKCKL